MKQTGFPVHLEANSTSTSQNEAMGFGIVAGIGTVIGISIGIVAGIGTVIGIRINAERIKRLSAKRINPFQELPRNKSIANQHTA